MIKDDKYEEFEQLKDVVRFHGHLCFGIALGYRVAKCANKYFRRDIDEDLVAIVGNNSCSVDAIQFLLGCTFGKGNLIHKDYGKHVYVFYSRNYKKALRISVKGWLFEYINSLTEDFENYKKSLKEENKNEEEVKERLKQYSKELREKIIDKVLKTPEKELLNLEWIEINPPKKAKIYKSIKCEECGEYFMEIKGRVANGKIVCKECFERLINE